MTAFNRDGLRRNKWVTRGSGRRTERTIATLAAALVVILGIDPSLLGLAWTSTARALTSGVIDETRAQNHDTALNALGLTAPLPSSEYVPGAQSEPAPPVALTLPADLPSGGEEPVELAGNDDGTRQVVEVGGLPVTIGPAGDEPAPDRVVLKVRDQAATQQAGITGLMLEVTDASDTPADDPQSVEVTVPFGSFASVGGADWSSRLQTTWVPECSAAETADAACRPVALESSVDQTTQTVTLTVPVAGSSTTERSAMQRTTATGASSGAVAIASGVAGPLGNWSATPLAASSKWGTSGSTGSFTWSYGMAVPPVPAGPVPQLALSYSSAVSDGRIPSSNNQSGLIGEGFDIGASYIERRYKPCSDDDTGAANNIGLTAHDLCWGPENATLFLNGSSTELVWDEASDTWHAKRDDGTRITREPTGGAEGEYWTVTTTDGTRYTFGHADEADSAWTVPVYGNHPDEPGHQATFKASIKQQVWRWNLDQVVDPSGNSATYRYTTETNQYRPLHADDAKTYVAGGHLDRIEYGVHNDDQVDRAPAKVEFTHAPRCITDLTTPNSWCNSGLTDTDANHWPDTPTDLICATGAGCETAAPTFFNRTRLSKITTYAASGSSYRPVDSWAMSQLFTPQGQGIGLEHATGIMLVLDGITRTGHAESGEPDVTLSTRFESQGYKNRVENADTGADALWRQRVYGIHTESGGHITVNYITDCTNGAENRTLCYPVKWQHPKELQPRTDYFNKYVVESIVEQPSNSTSADTALTGASPAVVTKYDYSQADWAWVKPEDPLLDEDDKTLSEFRGARQVTTLNGETGTQQSKTTTSYYRGTGETLSAPAVGLASITDHDRLEGEVFTSTVMNGAAKVTETVTIFGDPVTVPPNAPASPTTAERIPSQDDYSVTYRADGATVEHLTRARTAFNEYSQPTEVDDVVLKDRGVATSTNATCTTTSYAHKAGSGSAVGLADKHLVALPSFVETVAKPCDDADAAVRPDDLLSASKIIYNASGRPATTEVLDPEDGVGFIRASTTEYDSRGRVKKTTDAKDQSTSTTYVETLGLVTEVRTTNPLGHITSSQYDPLRGSQISSVDANGRITTGEYDAIGRLTEVRYPQHPKPMEASVEYAYRVETNGLNAVVTKTLSADGKRQHLSATLYDGLLRPIQTQQDGRGTGPEAQGRMVAHTIYDSAGRIVKQTEPWWVESAVSTTPQILPAQTPGHTTYQYDDAGRQTTQTFWVGTDSNVDYKKWEDVTSYDGAKTLQIPPSGGIPTETEVDARGRTVAVTQYHRDPDTQAGADTADEVRALPAHTTTAYSYDPAGRLTGMTSPASHQGIDAPPTPAVWTYEYDWAGRKIAASDPDSGDSTTTYDVLGRVATQTNGNGQKLAYTYDELGRTLSVHDDSVSGSVRASWKYDGSNLKGVLTESTRIVGGQRYVTRTNAWDAAYRPTETSLELPNTGAFTELKSRTLTTRYEYTADGQQAKVSYPAVVEADGSADGKLILGPETVTTVYDPDSSMPSWMSGGFGWGTYVASSRFGADGRPLSTDLGNTYGAVVTYQYEDGTKRLSKVSLDRERIDGTELELRYTYDPSGNVTSINDTPTRTELSDSSFHDNQCFNYDGLARLQAAWTSPSSADGCAQLPTIDTAAAAATGGPAAYWREYDYDILGNRTTERRWKAGSNPVETRYQYGLGNAGPHAVTTITKAGAAPSTYSYDEAGNRVGASTSGSPTAFEWDAEGELTAAGDASFTYDASGNRIVRTEPSGTTVYAGGQEIRIASNGNVSATRYYGFAGKTVSIRTNRGLGDGVTSIISDHHGTPVAAITNGGNPARTGINRLYTDPFGSRRGASTASTIPGETQFLGKTRDESTGLTQIGARYYDENIGQFISVDPVLDLNDPRQWNPYAYSTNNPVTRTDPTGLRPVDNSVDYGKYGKPKASGTGPAPAAPPQSVAPPVESSSGGEWWEPWNWSGSQWQDFGAAAGGVLVTVVVGAAVGACVIATAGICAGVGLGLGMAGLAAAGAAGSVATYHWSSGDKTAEGYLGAGVRGAVAGALFSPAIGGLAARGIAAPATSTSSKAVTAPVADTAPQIKAGTAGGPTAGKPFPQSVRQQSLAENPSTCVYCRLQTDKPQVDHAIPKARGGNATLDNAQTTCAHCNASKGARDYPVTPPEQYDGPWPPPWWGGNR